MSYFLNFYFLEEINSLRTHIIFLTTSFFFKKSKKKTTKLLSTRHTISWSFPLFLLFLNKTADFVFQKVLLSHLFQNLLSKRFL